MSSSPKLTYFLCTLIALITFQNTVLASLPEMKDNSSKIANHMNSSEILDDESRLLPGNYTPDQINEIIYHLYQTIQNSNSTNVKYTHDLAVLIDIVCSNELYESAVEACDIVSELPIESNEY